jgi:16S rRNA (cytosine967-C5)-methyltransferase
MKPKVRRFALEGLRAMDREDLWLRTWLTQGAERLSGAELAQAHDLLAGVIRWRSRLDAWIEIFASRSPDPWTRNLLRVAIYQLERSTRVPAHAVVSESVELAKRAKGPRVAGWANAVLRTWIREHDTRDPFSGEAGPADALAWPPWLLARLARGRDQEAAEGIAAALNERSTLDLRVNPARGSTKTLAADLSRDDRQVNVLDDPRGALSIEGASGLFSGDSAAPSDGRWIVQDRNSQRVAALVADELHGRVLDSCSGSGVKLLRYAVPMAHHPVTEIVALDQSGDKLQRGQALLESWGLGTIPDPVKAAPGITTLTADATATGLPEASFDVIVVDAPCSGTGTIRRRAEIKWRLSPKAVDGLGALQAQIQDEAVRLLKPGGTLIWIVCSLLHEEGPASAEALQARHPGVLVSRDLRSSDAVPWKQTQGSYQIFDPKAPGDGFHISVLKRT